MMRTYFYFVILLFIYVEKASTQTDPMNCLPEEISSQEHASSSCPFSELSEEEMNALPEVTVYVNIHYIKGPYGNFYPGNSTGDLKDGNYYASLLLNHANNDLDHLIPSPVGISHKLGDAKINYKLYSNPNNTSDVNGGIWYWNQEPTSFPYANVMNIVLFNGGPNDELKGTACGRFDCCSRLSMTGAYYHVWVNPIQPKFGHWAFAQLLNHEFFHSLGLCHSFYINNECNDLNPAAECGCGNGASGCGNGGFGCCSWNSNSTNIMNYAPSLKSLSLCQWGTAYNNAISKNCPFLNFCETKSEPIIIEAGTQVIWDHLMIINRPVILMPSSSLTITCEARFSTEAYVEVRRGAKLTVDGALLTNLCPDNFWPGIQVWGNPGKLQPDPSNGITGINDAGIVQVINGSTIQHARTAISTGAWALGGSNAWANFGGAVYCENSSFVDNRRAIEFMKYNYPNKSKIINCIFSENGNYVDNSIGVTIWECNDITFIRNTFRFLDIAGIFGVDFGAKIYDHNQFRNLPSGIESYNTLYYKGSLEIGQNNSNPNYFKNNIRHIYCSSGNGLDRVNIINNDLFDATGNGIIMEGYSYYNIENNRFRNIPLAVVSDASGDDHNLIKCNQFDKHENGILFKDINEQTQFLDNCFPSNIDISVVIEPGSSIRSEQGDNSRVANNCMQSKIDIYAPSPFYTFQYFARQQAQSIYCDLRDPNCETPTNNLSDGGFNNYYVTKIFVESSSNCSGAGDERFSPNLSLLASRSKLNDAKIQLAFDTDNPELKKEAKLAEAELNSILKYTLTNLISTNAYQEALALLVPQESDFELKIAVGLNLMLQNCNKAEELLSSIPENDTSLSIFKSSQLLNLKRLRDAQNFTLNEFEYQELEDLADSNSPDKSFPKALLALQTGNSQARNYLPTEIPITVRKNSKAINDNIHLALFPNPVSNTLQVYFDTSKTKAKSFSIFNTIGFKILEGTLNHSGKLQVNLEQFKDGVYIFCLLDLSGCIIERKSFMINKN